jgi:hypothetical protein
MLGSKGGEARDSAADKQVVNRKIRITGERTMRRRLPLTDRDIRDSQVEVRQEPACESGCRPTTWRTPVPLIRVFILSHTGELRDCSAKNGQRLGVRYLKSLDNDQGMVFLGGHENEVILKGNPLPTMVRETF